MTSRSPAIGALLVGALCGFAASAQAATGVGVLALAAIPALFALPGRWRRWLGAGVAAAGVLVGAAAGLDGPTGDPLAWLSVAAVVLAGVLVAWHGPAWTSGALQRGDQAPQPAGSTDLWKALDRGEDPTVGDAPEAELPNSGPGEASVD